MPSPSVGVGDTTNMAHFDAVGRGRPFHRFTTGVAARFTTGVAARHARLASSWRAAPLPGGSRTRWTATRGFSSRHPPLQGLPWRYSRPDNPYCGRPNASDNHRSGERQFDRHRRCQSVMPTPWAASTIAGSSSTIPVTVFLSVGKTLYMVRAAKAGRNPIVSPSNGTISARSAMLGTV